MGLWGYVYYVCIIHLYILSAYSYMIINVMHFFNHNIRVIFCGSEFCYNNTIIMNKLLIPKNAYYLLR